jgi:Transposase DDE domain
MEIFCEADDFCKTFQDAFERHLSGNGPGSRGPNPGLADAEIITLLLVRPSSGFKYWKSFYNRPMGEVLRRYVPGRPGYERLIALQQRALLAWVALLFSKRGKKTGIDYLDFTALPVCHRRRSGPPKPFAGWAARGKTCLGWFGAFRFIWYATISRRSPLSS